KTGALQHLGDQPGPRLPMRRLAMQRKDPAIYHRVAAEPVGGAPAERLAIVLPGQRTAKEFRTFVVPLVGTIDLGDDREPIPARGGAIELDRTPILQPGIGVDPQIRLMPREMPRQKRARDLRFERFRGAVTAGKFDVPFWANKLHRAI